MFVLREEETTERDAPRPARLLVEHEGTILRQCDGHAGLGKELGRVFVDGDDQRKILGRSNLDGIRHGE
ncbi:MAG TPA: hypothetical protein VH062_32765 [Polyangiaceae bacterium]|nr:hypothetical protein [Polyangiaceae bacterium]